MRILLLDFPGLVASIFIGLVVILSSGEFMLQNFTLLFLFLLISVAATKYRHSEKKEKGLYEHERGWSNVLSNGSVPALCCVQFYLTGSFAWIYAYICSLAAALGDKFGSELGVLSEKPISLANFKRVRPGTSGAISKLGTFMSFVGPLIIATIAYFLFNFRPIMIFVISLIGFIGSFADTIAGIFEERGIGTKGTSNIICTLVGALLGYILVIR